MNSQRCCKLAFSLPCCWTLLPCWRDKFSKLSMTLCWLPTDPKAARRCKNICSWDVTWSPTFGLSVCGRTSASRAARDIPCSDRRSISVIGLFLHMLHVSNCVFLVFGPDPDRRGISPARSHRNTVLGWMYKTKLWIPCSKTTNLVCCA